MTSTRLIDKKELAGRLGMGVSTVSNLRSQGHPFFTDKAVRHGRKVMWKSTDVDAYIDALDYDDQ